MISLNEFLEKENKVDEKFVVDDDQKANWVLRKIVSLEEKKQANDELAKAEIEKIKEWLEQVNSGLDQDIEYFQSLLAQYAEAQRKLDPKFKSRKLPNGKFGFRKLPAKWQYDDKRLLDHLKQNGLTDICGKWVSLVVECDGHDFHEKTKEQAKRDKSRDRDLQAAGITVLRFTGSEIYNDINQCIIDIELVIKQLINERG